MYASTHFIVLNYITGHKGTYFHNVLGKESTSQFQPSRLSIPSMSRNGQFLQKKTAKENLNSLKKNQILTCYNLTEILITFMALKRKS